MVLQHDEKITAENTDQLCDIVGRYTITINGKEYDTVRVLSLDSYYGEYVCCEQYIDSNGRTILWRRFNRDDWAIDRYKKKWSEQLPNNESYLTIFRNMLKGCFRLWNMTRRIRQPLFCHYLI